MKKVKLFAGGVASGKSKLTTSAYSGIIKPATIDDVSALGVNYFNRGFSQENLNKHWGGDSDHSNQYPQFTKQQYANYAKALASSAADEKIILGYKMADGTICRYNAQTNDYVKGNPIYDEIYTCFKPSAGKQYFHKRKKLDGGTVK